MSREAQGNVSVNTTIRELISRLNDRVSGKNDSDYENLSPDLIQSVAEDFQCLKNDDDVTVINCLIARVNSLPNTSYSGKQAPPPPPPSPPPAPPSNKTEYITQKEADVKELLAEIKSLNAKLHQANGSSQLLNTSTSTPSENTAQYEDTDRYRNANDSIPWLKGLPVGDSDVSGLLYELDHRSPEVLKDVSLPEEKENLEEEEDKGMTREEQAEP